MATHKSIGCGTQDMTFPLVSAQSQTMCDTNDQAVQTSPGYVKTSLPPIHLVPIPNFK